MCSWSLSFPFFLDQVFRFFLQWDRNKRTCSKTRVRATFLECVLELVLLVGKARIRGWLLGNWKWRERSLSTWAGILLHLFGCSFPHEIRISQGNGSRKGSRSGFFFWELFPEEMRKTISIVIMSKKFSDLTSFQGFLVWSFPTSFYFNKLQEVPQS